MLLLKMDIRKNMQKKNKTKKNFIFKTSSTHFIFKSYYAIN